MAIHRHEPICNCLHENKYIAVVEKQISRRTKNKSLNYFFFAKTAIDELCVCVENSQNFLNYISAVSRARSRSAVRSHTALRTNFVI